MIYLRPPTSECLLHFVSTFELGTLTLKWQIFIYKKGRSRVIFERLYSKVRQDNLISS